MARTMTDGELEYLFNRALTAENLLYEARERGAHPNDIAQIERFYRFYEGKMERASQQWREQCGH